MAYNLDTLKTSFENAKFDRAYYSVFFAEADKYIREIISTSPLTAKAFGEAASFFNEAYDYDDFIQDCLIKLWEYIVEMKLVHPDGITTYITTAVRYKLLDFIKRESRRKRIATFEDMSEAETTPYFDNFDDEEKLYTASEAMKDYEPGEKQPEEKIVQFEKNTYKKVAEFSTIAEAAEATGIDKGNISKVLSGKGKTAGGYIWVKSTNPLIEVLCITNN